MFKPFFKDNSGKKASVKGMGLGLTIVKIYCDILRANINIESVEDKGTKVTITFPEN